METNIYPKTENLERFANFLADHESINGYMDSGQLKETFGRLGKKALKELAGYMGLKEYMVDFNKAGESVSGDLSLMGMFSPDKGIYISFNKDGMSSGVLYRSIKHMKDFSGGNNNFFPEMDFINPEDIKQRVYSLLKLSENPDPKDEKEEQQKQQETKIEKPRQTFFVKELYEKIIEGKEIERLPELIDYFHNGDHKEELKIWGLAMPELISSPDFLKNLNTNLWNLVPDTYKRLRTIKPIEWKADPQDKGLRQLVENFVGRDEIRTHMMGANFDKNGIVATDAHKLIFLNKVKSSKKGIFCLTKLCFKALGKEGEDEAIIQGKFPDYTAILPKEVNITRRVSVEQLRLFCNTLIKVGMTIGKQHRGILRYEKDQYMGMNLGNLLSSAEAFARLGFLEVDMGFIAFDKPLLMAPEGRIKEITDLATPFVLLMPIVPNEYSSGKTKKYDMERGDIYFDLLKQQVRTYGIEEAPTQAEKPGEAKTALSSIALLTADEWFKQHPDKILGEQYQTTDRFNKPVTRVRGNMDNIIQGIDVPAVDIPEEKSEALETEIKQPLQQLLNDPEKRNNILRVVNQTKKANAEKALKQLEQKNNKSVSDTDETADTLEEHFSFDYIMKEYNKGISEEEVKAWIWHKRTTGGFNYEKTILDSENGWSKYVIPITGAADHLKNWLKAGIVCYDNGSFVPSVLYYAENIYERQSMLLKEKENIIKQFGQEQYDRQWEGLENVKPPKLTLTDPNINNRLFIKPDSSFAKEIHISQLEDGTSFKEYIAKTGDYTNGSTSLVEAFKTWLNALPKDDFKKSTDWNIIQYYLEAGTPSRHYDKEEKLRLRQNAKIEGDRFFIRFLAEALTREDQLRIEQRWNAKYNGYVEINYFKVPVAFNCSGTFKNKPLFIRPAQREGIGFISVHGSGCIAYDVGLGKTMTAILALAQALESGQCKRPFIVVPNQTYKNWILEIQGVVEKGKIILTGLLPQYRVMDLYNLGAEYIDQLRDDKGNIKPVPENTISILTYEGFNRLGFNENTWHTIGSELFDILNQGTEEKRDVVKLQEKIDEMMGKGIKGGSVNIEDLGFDYMVVDEAHAMKKSFTQVKGEINDIGENATRARTSYQIRSGTPSMTALRGFMISQYILRNNRMRNVLLLTATPFTNSPLEIYSVLALIGYQQLERAGIKNIKEFFDTFIKTSMELVINAKLKPERREIVLGFNNLIALQQLIFKFITYKTGEDAKIQRPNKIVLPLLNKREGDKLIPLPPEEQVSTNLPMTQRQKEYMNDVELYVTGKTSLTNFCVNSKGFEDTEEEDGQEDTGEVLDEKHLSDDEEEGTRILRGMSFARQLALSPYLYACNPDKHPTYIKYIESSPKLQYVMECIRSVKQYHEQHGEEVSGQVIYMNAGVHFFPLIKEYLVQKIGYKEDEVGIIKSGISAAKKEGIKERFLAGSVKIIIGSATIKEGINLQNRSTVLYNCWLDWNPTDVKQLEGRIWRFGNMYANVRIVNPMMEDSIDTFIFQKLEEKTSRINEIWYRAGKTNALNLEEFNPGELKMGLVTDPFALAELILMEERERVQDEITGLSNQKSVLEEIAAQREIFNKNIGHVKKVVNKYRPQKDTDKARSLETIFKIYRDYLDDEKTEYTYQDQIVLDLVRKANALIKRGIEQILAPRGLDIGFDLKKITARIDKEIERKRQYMEEKTGDQAVQDKANEIIKDRIKKGYKPKTVAERVQEFSKMNEKLLGERMVYEAAPESKNRREQMEKKGRALEESADTVEEMQRLLDAMEKMQSLLSEMEKLSQAA